MFYVVGLRQILLENLVIKPIIIPPDGVVGEGVEVGLLEVLLVGVGDGLEDVVGVLQGSRRGLERRGREGRGKVGAGLELCHCG